MYILANSDRFDFIFIRTIFRFGIIVFCYKLIMKLILKVSFFRFIFELLHVVLSINVLSELSEGKNS